MSENLEIIRNADGIGPSTLDDFRDAGFESAEEVGSRTPEELADEVKRVGYSTAISVLKYLEKQGLRDTSNRDADLERLVELLRDLFEFENQDYDFGIYKLMNANREEIDEYIEEDLVGKIESEVRDLYEKFISQSKSRSELQTEVVNELGNKAWDDSGEGLSQEAKREIENRMEGFSEDELENARSDIYNQLYQFFSNYYENGDFITRRRRSHHEDPYSVPYDGSNTHFHWVTKDQYYAKTSDQHTRFKFKNKNTSFIFRLTDETFYEEADDSGKSEYFIMEKPEEFDIYEGLRTINIRFSRQTVDDEDLLERCDVGQNNRTSFKNTFKDELCSFLAEQEIGFEEERIKNRLDEYLTKNQKDFFIHKNLEKFLTNELEEHIKTEVVSFDPNSGLESMSELDIEKGRIVNQIGTDVISFISQIEEFKRKLFEKKKFVKDSKQLVQVENISRENYEVILQNDKQLADWATSFNVNDDELTVDALGDWPYNQMMVDTSYFEQDITTGEESENKLIKGDNYQALNFLHEKYEDSVKCIYIDPPYNTGNANFAYKDNYQRPTWLSMMYDRLKLSRKLLKDDGVIFASIDYREVDNLRFIMNEIFGEENREATITWRRKKETSNDANGFSPKTEFIVCYSMGGFSPNKMPLDDEYVSDAYRYEDDRGKWRATPITLGSGKQGGGYDYSIETPSGRVIEDKKWTHPKETVEELREKNMIYFGQNGDGIPQKKLYLKENDGRSPDDLWLDVGTNKLGRKSLKSIFGDGFSGLTPKPVELIRHILKISISDGESATVLDFFAGSGTTAQAVQELNREREEQVNYVLVEMLDEAFEITEERVKRTAYTEDWKDGEPQVDNIEDINTTLDLDVECIELESYEEALDAIEFESTQQTIGSFDPTKIQYLLDFGTKDSPVFLDTDQLSSPLEYELSTEFENTSVDVMKTFNYLIGLQNVQESKLELSGVEYTTYEGVIENDSVLVVWRHNAGEVDYESEIEEFEESEYERIYINGDSLFEKSTPISKVFNRKIMNQGDSL